MRCLTCNTDLIDIHYRDTNNSYILEKDNNIVMFSCDKSISDNNSNTYKYLYCEDCKKITDYSEHIMYIILIMILKIYKMNILIQIKYLL